MKQIAILLLCVIAFTANGQSKTKKISASKQINIPTTRLFITPPAGFKPAANFTGLQKENTTTVLQVYDLPGGSYYANGATFSKESFEKQGMQVFEYKELKLNGYPAKYIYMQGNAGAKSHAVIFGDSTFSVMMVSAYPTADDATGKTLKAAMLSATYNKQFNADPLASATFKLDESKSAFKFNKAAGGTFIYAINGNIEDPILIVTPLPANGIKPGSISDMLLKSLEEYGFTDKEVKYKTTNKVNGYDAYETLMYGNLKGQKAAVYQLVVIKDDKAVSITGTMKSNYEAMILECKNLAQTVTFKTK